MNTDSGEVLRKVLRVLAEVSAVVASICGAIGVGAAIAGDKYLTDGTIVAIAAVLTVVAFIAAFTAWWRPILAALAMLVTIGGYWYVIASSWGSFWSAYQTAVQTSGAAENQFWTSGVIAVPSLALAIPFLVIGVAMALFAHDWNAATRPHIAAVS